MRVLLLLLNELSSRLDRRSRRFLLMACTAGLTLYARSTGTALQSANFGDALAGFALLLLFAAGSAAACTRRE